MDFKHIKACVSAADFTNAGYTKESGGVYTKEDFRFFVNPYTGGYEAVSRMIKFKVLDVDPILGTNIEYYVNNNLQLSGYWTTRKDFKSSIKL